MSFCFCLGSSPVHSDIVLERHGDIVNAIDGTSDDDLPLSYLPKDALHTAIREWLPLFSEERHMSVKKVAAPPSPVITAPANPMPTPGVSVPCTPGVGAVKQAAAAAAELDNESYMQPAASLAPVNSLLEHSESDADSGVEAVEPMEVAPLPPPAVLTSQDSTPSGYDSGVADCSVADGNDKLGLAKEEVMQVDSLATAAGLDCDKGSAALPIATSAARQPGEEITCEDLHLLVELFYMPFEHGVRSSELLSEFVWLKLNCCYVTGARSKSATDEQKSRCAEWMDRAEQFKQKLAFVDATMNKLLNMPNKAILRDLFSYIWDMKTILSLIESFVCWLGTLSRGKRVGWSNDIHDCTYL